MLRQTVSSLLVAAVSALVVGCASSEPADPNAGADGPRATTRELLAKDTDLFVSPTTSGGAITARRWSPDGWVSAEVPLVIDNGVVVASAPADGSSPLAISTIDILLAPIDLPYPAPNVAARLDRLKLDLAKGPLVPTNTKWSANDESASATAEASLVLSWAVAIDDTITMLGPQHLPPIPVDVHISGGDGRSVLATLTFDLRGEVWGWADLIALDNLRLVVDTASD